MIEDRSTQRIYSKRLTLEDFTLTECRAAFSAILESQTDNLHLDLSIAVTKYGLNAILGYGSLFNPEDAKAWFEILRQTNAKRSLGVGANRVIQLLQNNETLAKDAHLELIKVNTDVRLKIYGENRKTKKAIVDEYLKKLQAAKNSDGVVGLRLSGQKKLDQLLNGFERTDFIVCAGRPGMGKTAHTIDMVRMCILQNLTGRYYSLEMSADQLLTRLISNLSGNRYSRLSRGEVDIESSHNEAIELFMNSKVEIIDKGGMTFDDIANDALAAAESNSIDLIIIDFLQLVTDRENTDETAILNKVARGCKSMAKELDCVVVGLSQLNRGVESRGNKMPVLSDLKQSGAIEEAADKVLFYYRPSYYGFDQLQVFDSNKWDGVNADRIIVAKNRSGMTGDHNTTFDFDKMGFVDKTENDINAGNDVMFPANADEITW